MDEKDPRIEPEDTGYTVEDIIKDYYSDAENAPAPELEDVEPAAAPDIKTAPETEPEPELEPVSELESEPESEPERSDFEPEPEEPDGEPENSGVQEKVGKSRKPRVRKPDTELIGVAAACVPAAALTASALIFQMSDMAWSILVIAGMLLACLPLIAWSWAHIKDPSRSRAPAVMFVSVVMCVAAVEPAEAGIAAIIFDILFLILERVSARLTGNVLDRLDDKCDGIDPNRDMRLSQCLTELRTGKIGAVSELRLLEKYIFFGAAAAAVFFALIPALLDGFDFLKWLARASVLVSVCVYSGELGALLGCSEAVEDVFDNGLWIGGTGVIEAAADIGSVLYNKTGAVTDGVYTVADTDPVRISHDQLLYLAAYAGVYSEHPINKAVRAASGVVPDRSLITNQRVIPGYGSMVRLEGGQLVGIGNIDFMETLGVKGNMYVPGCTCAFVCVDKVCVGRIDFTDSILPDSVNAAGDLRRAGVANVAIMTGDNALSATNVARRVGITEIYSDCRPKDKLERLRYIQDTQDPGDRTAFVSRAGCDRELLELANVSVTIGVGEDTTAHFPDVIIADGGVSRLSRLIRVSARVRKNATVTFFASAAARLLTAILGLTGVLPLWGSVLVMFALHGFSLYNTKIK